MARQNSTSAQSELKKIVIPSVKILLWTLLFFMIVLFLKYIVGSSFDSFVNFIAKPFRKVDLYFMRGNHGFLLGIFLVTISLIILNLLYNLIKNLISKPVNNNSVSGNSTIVTLPIITQVKEFFTGIPKWLLIVIGIFLLPILILIFMKIITMTIGPIVNSYGQSVANVSQEVLLAKKTVGDYVPLGTGGSWNTQGKVTYITIEKGKRTGPINFSNVGKFGFRAENGTVHANTGGTEPYVTFEKGGHAKGFTDGNWYFSAEKYFVENPTEKTKTLRITLK